MKSDRNKETQPWAQTAAIQLFSLLHELRVVVGCIQVDGSSINGSAHSIQVGRWHVTIKNTSKAKMEWHLINTFCPIRDGSPSAAPITKQ